MFCVFCLYLPQFCDMFEEKGGKRMNGQVIELYTDADMDRLRRHIRRWRTALGLLAAAALAACLVLAGLTNTANAQRMELAAVAVSTLAGWVVLYGVIFVVSPARREMEHAAMLRREERQTAAGTVTVTDERFVIRKSVAVRRVEVRGEDETQRLLVCESRAKVLAAVGTAVLYTCHGYVAAYEVTV